MVCFTIEAQQASGPVKLCREVLVRKIQSNWLLKASVLPITSLRGQPRSVISRPPHSNRSSRNLPLTNLRRGPG